MAAQDSSSTEPAENSATAVFKLAEVASKLLFLLVALLLLDSRSAGQFGLLNTLIALFMLVTGYERWGVLWRQLVNIDIKECNALISQTLKFFQFNYLVWAPVFVVIGLLWIELTPIQVVLGLCIAVCEQLTAGGYWLATVQGRFRWLVLVAAAKNGSLLAVTVAMVLGSSQPINLSLILQLWALAGLGSLLVFVRLHRGDNSAKLSLNAIELEKIVAQYRESTAHFITGFAAFSSGQIDRITVGTAVGLALTGVYFKNVFLAASVYSAVTILLLNRSAPKIYRAAASKNFPEALRIARSGSGWALAVYCILGILLQVIDQTPLSALLEKYNASTTYIAGLLVAFFFRTLADFNCSILNAAGRERTVLTVHLLSMLPSAFLIYFLSREFGIGGAVAAMIFSSVTLYGLSTGFRISAFKALAAQGLSGARP